MKKQLISATLLIAITIGLFAFTKNTNKEYVVFSCYSSGYFVHLNLLNKDGSVAENSVIPYAKYSSGADKGTGGGFEVVHLQRSQIVVKKINEICQKGYKVFSYTENANTLTVLLEKE